MKTFLYLSAFSLFAVSQTATALAQPSPAPMVIAAQDPSAIILPMGTNVRLRLLSTLSSQDNKTGQQFDFEVAEDVMLNGRAIITRGSPGIGELRTC